MRRVFLLSVIVFGLFAQAMPARAHPLGNFTTNVHLGIDVAEQRLSVLLVVDMAEIPTFREPLDVDDDGAISERDLDSYAEASCDQHREAIELTTDRDIDLALATGTNRSSLARGSGGLSTLRLECHYEAEITERSESIEVVNRVYDDRTGWAEIVVRGTDAEGAVAQSPSATLTDYPDGAPLDLRSATVLLRPAALPTSTSPAGPARPPVTGWLGTLAGGGGVLAIVGALGLGVTHALAPGHGKTLMAAYLVGRRGTARHAAGLGLATAISHTLGVAVLGLVTATASSRFQPETVYPWLTTISAATVTAVGGVLLFRAVMGRGHHHSGHGHDNDSGHSHDHHHDDHHPHPESIDGWKSLAALGLAGGLVPSASAVVLLLGALAIGRPWFGLLLVASFGIGMSIALVGAGLAALKISETGLERLGRRFIVRPRLVSTAAGVAVMTVGVVLLWDAARPLIG